MTENAFVCSIVFREIEFVKDMLKFWALSTFSQMVRYALSKTDLSSEKSRIVFAREENLK